MKKKILMLTSGHVPVPASKSGGVENLIDIFIAENEKFKDCKLDVISIYDTVAEEMAKNLEQTKLTYIHPKKGINFLNKISYLIADKFLRKENSHAYSLAFTRLDYIHQAAKYIKQHGDEYEFVIIENHPSAFMALKKYKNYKKFEDKMIYHIHNEFEETYGCKHIIEQAKIICVSQFIADSMLRRFHLKKEQVHVLRNCVAEQELDPILNLKKHYNIPTENKIISFFGRIVPEKGVLELVKAMNQIDMKNLTVLIIGSAAFNEDVISQYEKKVKIESENSKHQIIATGYIDYKKIANYYMQSDLIVVPSIWDDPAPLTVIESIVYDRPLVATRSGGIPEYAREGTAMLVERDIELINNLSNNIEMLLRDEKAKIDINNKRHLIRKEFTTTNYYKKYQSFIS